MINRISGFALVAIVALSFAACQPGADTGVAIDYAGFDSFGDVTTHATTESDVVTPMMLVSNTADVEGKTVTVSGTVREVCQMMGCWLTLDTGGDASAIIRVSVPRDTSGAYVFTVPKDISGRIAYVTGYVEDTEVDAETLEHYAEDAARAAGESDDDNDEDGDEADDDGGEEHGPDHDHGAEHDSDEAPASTREIKITASAISLIPVPPTSASILSESDPSIV